MITTARFNRVEGDDWNHWNSVWDGGGFKGNQNRLNSDLNEILFEEISISNFQTVSAFVC